jgi:branched-chain amino acid transport system substrate-binding protein
MTGSRNVGQVLKSGVLDKVALPIVGAVPGQDSVQAMLNKNMFHFRAGDRNQLEKIIEQLTTMGIKNIAALASTNPNGKEAVGIIEQTLEKRGLKLSVYAAYNVSDKSGFSQPVKQVVDLKPDAIILQGPPDMIATLTKELRARGVTALLYSLSYADFRLIAKVVGPDSARGVVISQVLPNLNNRALPLVRAFREDFDKYAKTKDEPSHFNLEGYMSARLIVEAIRKTRDPSPQGVIRGLEQMHEFDMGGYIVDFSPVKHTGSTWVDLSMISRNGTLIY